MFSKSTLGNGFRFQNLGKALFTLGALLGLVALAGAQTINIGPNQYAFRYTNNNNYGLFFNSTDVQYEFRDGSASPIWAVDAFNGLYRTNIKFDNGANYMVGNGNYVWRTAGQFQKGMYMSNSQMEIRDGSGNAIATFNTNNGNMTATGAMYANGGNSNQWNSAYGWGNHATAGYLTSESDPQVGSNSSNKVPRWNGSALVSGNITDNGSTVDITNPTTVNSGYNGSTSSSGLRVGSTTSTHLGLDNNEVQAYSSSGSDAMLYLNYWGGDINFGSSTMSLDRSTERIGINSGLPGTKFDVQGETTNTEGLIRAEVNHSTSTDTRAIEGESVPAPGYGYGLYGTGGYRGVYGYGNGTSYTGTVAGVYGYASGTAGTRIGLYGFASGGTTNWAGYFVGNTYTSGTASIGTTATAAGYTLNVDGKIIGEEVKVQLSQNWPDYVFDEAYELMPLDELEGFVSENNHLPGIPSAKEVSEDEGIELGEMQRRTVEKLEELTLYILELKKENDNLKNRIDQLEK